MDNKYAKAYTEILELIKYLPENEYNKIPSEKIDFYEKNKDKEYKFIFNPDKPIEEQITSRETNAIIIQLFRDYFASESQKEKLKELLKTNDKKYDEELREKYNPDVFAERRINDKTNNTPILNEEPKSLVEYKEPIIKRVINYIINIFKRIK